MVKRPVQAKAIEERRRRMAAIKAKHQAAREVTNPTATALADREAGTAPPSAAATPAPSGAQGTPERLNDQPQLTPERPGGARSAHMVMSCTKRSPVSSSAAASVDHGAEWA